MREIEAGKLVVRLTGGEDREGGGSGPLVILMHGFGAPGDDLVTLWRELAVPRETRFAFPEAPLALGEFVAGVDSRAWWMMSQVASEAPSPTGSVSVEKARSIAPTRSSGVTRTSQLGAASEIGFDEGAIPPPPAPTIV